MDPGAAKQNLKHYLVGAYTPEDLGRLAKDFGLDLVSPNHIPVGSFALELVEEWCRHYGPPDARLFDLLRKERPHRAAELDALAHLFVNPVPTVRTDSPGATAGSPTFTATGTAGRTWAQAACAHPLWKHVQADDTLAWRDDVAALLDLWEPEYHRLVARTQPAVAAAPWPDTWRDEGLPSRILDRLSDTLAGKHLSPAEAMFATLAPYVREFVFAAGHAWIIEAADPHDLETHSDPDEPRQAYRRTVMAEPAAARQAQGADPKALDVRMWLARRAVARLPMLWNHESSDPPGLLLAEIRDRVCERFGSADVFTKLIAFGKSLGAGPDRLDAENGGRQLLNVELRGQQVKVKDLSTLLAFASAAALDLRDLDALVLDHIGRDDAYDAGMLRTAVAAARWSYHARQWTLLHGCVHPVEEFALRRLVERTSYIAELYHDATGNALVGGIPPAAGGAGLEPVRDGGAPRYRHPLVHFRLDHQHIRELLMGEALYGEPELALREMFQNAQDACRYRLAREVHLARAGGKPRPGYDGAIEFTQALQGNREYVECRDDGVGMSMMVLERVFAVAGCRFHDLPLFLEERSRWSTLAARLDAELGEQHKKSVAALRFTPNSQHGIGVLSYFMLADVVEVWTRELRTDGTSGEPLHIKISSVSGLFFVSPGKPDQALGTTVRVYLKHTADASDPDPRKHNPLDVRSTLSSLVVISGFSMRVRHHADPTDIQEWFPGQPKVGTKILKAVHPTAHPNVYWIDSRSPHINLGQALADGVVVGSDSKRDHLLVNYCGGFYPKLTANRKAILTCNGSLLEDAASVIIAGLETCPFISYNMINNILDATPKWRDEIHQVLSKGLSPYRFLGMAPSIQLFTAQERLRAYVSALKTPLSHSDFSDNSRLNFSLPDDAYRFVRSDRSLSALAAWLNHLDQRSQNPHSLSENSVPANNLVRRMEGRTPSPNFSDILRNRFSHERTSTRHKETLRIRRILVPEAVPWKVQEAKPRRVGVVYSATPALETLTILRRLGIYTPEHPPDESPPRTGLASEALVHHPSLRSPHPVPRWLGWLARILALFRGRQGRLEIDPQPPIVVGGALLPRGRLADALVSPLDLRRPQHAFLFAGKLLPQERPVVIDRCRALGQFDTWPTRAPARHLFALAAAIELSAAEAEALMRAGADEHTWPHPDAGAAVAALRTVASAKPPVDDVPIDEQCALALEWTENLLLEYRLDFAEAWQYGAFAWLWWLSDEEIAACRPLAENLLYEPLGLLERHSAAPSA